MAIQALNYSTHAIEDLISYRDHFDAPSAPLSFQALNRLITLLTNGVKFILPNRGHLLDPNSLNQAHLDLTSLPFPCTVFEAPWQMEDEDFIEYVGEYKTVQATKRIALCWDSREVELMPGMNHDFHVDHPEGGTFVLPIYLAKESSWIPTMGGVFLPRVNTIKVNPTSELPAISKANAAAREAGLALKSNAHFGIEPFILLPEIFQGAVNEVGEEQALAQVLLDCRDEAQMVIAACSVLNCANVVTADLPAPPALNKKRTEKGKLPFFSYKVLQLDVDAPRTSRAGGDGSHAPPRMHLRRGHLRRLESKTIWVRAAVINASSPDGIVSKDYALRAS